LADPANDTTARNRWLVINLVRMASVAMVVVGLLGTQGAVDIPLWGAYVLLAIGFASILFLPFILARRWSSRNQ